MKTTGPLTISRVRSDKKHYLPLLLLGDESEAMIDRYIGHATLFVGCIHNEPVAVCATVRIDFHTVEVKNLAVCADCRRQGFGRRMLRHVEAQYPDCTITLGTGETPSTLRFYKSCGYRYSHRVAGFFTDNYPVPIVEEGVTLRDMIYLSKPRRKSAGRRRCRRLRFKPVARYITDYVEKEVMPRYAAFDKAHREDHVRMVIEQSLRLAAHSPSFNADMVYIIAAFHDLGLVHGRDKHHLNSRKILEADPFLRANFTPRQIRVMGCAVEDHRASAGRAPRNGYGMIVAEADRFIDAETIIRRTIQYGLANYPELDRDGHYRRAVSHLAEKYGPGGYLKIRIPWSDNAARLEELRSLIANRRRLDLLFDRIYSEETESRQKQ